MTTTEDTAVEKLKKKILALLRKAESSEHEAEQDAFATKARQLMDEHRLTMRDLTTSVDPMGRTVVACPYNNQEYVVMAAAGGRFLGCDTLISTRRVRADNKKGYKTTKGVIFVGRESARVTAEILTPFWWSQCNRRGRRKHREDGLGRSPADAVHLMMVALAFRLDQMADRPEEVDAARDYRGDVPKARKGKDLTLDLDALVEAQHIPTALQLGGA